MMTPYKITDIERIYPNWYKMNSSQSRDNQQDIWEITPLPEKDEQRLLEIQKPKKNNDPVNGNVIGSYKPNTNSEQKLSKNEANKKLSKCNYRTPPKEIASYLKTIFGVWKEKPDHWLFIAQRYTPKTIISVLSWICKQQRDGRISLKIPGAYFTSVIKFRPKRKAFRNTNGSYKQHEKNNN